MASPLVLCRCFGVSVECLGKRVRVELQDRSWEVEVLLATRVDGQEWKMSSEMYVRKTMVQLAVWIGATGGTPVVVAAMELVGWMLSDEGDDAAVVDAADAVVKFETAVVLEAAVIFHAAVVYGA